MSRDWVGGNASVFKTLGASNHCDHERQADDYYATEPSATEWLCKLVELDKHIWEPACGEGHMAKVLFENGHVVKATDLIDRGYGDIQDFLTTEESFDGDIVTNPPYKYARQFVEKAINIVNEGNKVCMFLKLTFLEGKARKSLFLTTPPPLGFRKLSEAEMCHEWRV